MAEGIKPKMAWGRTSEDVEQQQPVVSFVEIMEEQEKNEEIEMVGQFDFDISLCEDDCSRDYFLALELSRDPDCSADELLAAKLQREYDRELELSQKFEESRAATGKATALLSSETYSSRYIKEQNEDHEESSDEEYEEEFKEFATKLLYGLVPDSGKETLGEILNPNLLVKFFRTPVLR
uniref:Uncharacterized protein n=1 Tax=Meloidogyne incognita TaxID=6306 RepID=A0A914L568_MELIC